ncbi:MAG: hypothetical protein SOX70_02495 [Peptoniphilaceae bacterium]|nr:hypothetical protein [Peptoniphilaceae bacterium]
MRELKVCRLLSFADFVGKRIGFMSRFDASSASAGSVFCHEVFLLSIHKNFLGG